MEEEKQQQARARAVSISAASSPNGEEEGDLTRPPMPGPQPGPDRAAPPLLPRPQLRRKASSVRPWMVVTESGQSRLEEVGRYPMMRRTGLPVRDLRALDAATEHPAGILPRRRALLVHLEHARAVITATEVWVADPGDPLVAPFVRELQTRIADFYAAVLSLENGNSALDAENQSSEGRGDPAQVSIVANAPESFVPAEENSMVVDEKHDGSKRITGSSSVLSFEFRALEVCLESVCGRLDFETLALEKEAYLAMNGLNSKISTHKFERVRQIKTRLLSVAGRAKKVRDELERILDSDTDMVEMHLTEKLVHERRNNLLPKYEIENDAFYSCREGTEDYSLQSDQTEVLPQNPSGPHQDVQELEKLLEAYFVQTEGILTRLSITRELVDDAVNYANILLDDRQNQLLHLGVVISTAAVVTSSGVVVTNNLGYSLRITIFNQGTPKQFWEAAIGIAVSGVILYLAIIGCFKRKGILV